MLQGRCHPCFWKEILRLPILPDSEDIWTLTVLASPLEACSALLKKEKRKKLSYGHISPFLKALLLRKGLDQELSR